MAINQDIIRRLTVVAQTKGVDELRAELERLASTQKRTGDAALDVTKQFKAQERALFPLIKAQQDLEKTARLAFNNLVQGGADAARAATLLAGATEKFNAVAVQAKTAAQAQAEALKRQAQAYIEEGKAVRQAADAQAHYNRVLGVSSGSGTNGQAIANQMRDRIAATEAEIKARTAAAEAMQRRMAAAQASVNDPFRSGLSGKSASDSASVFAENFAAVERRTQAVKEEGRAVREAAQAQEFYNRILGVGTRNENGAAIAAQMQARIAETEAEIARRQNSGAARMAAQAGYAAPYRSAMSGKSAADSASIFEASFAADAERNRAAVDRLRSSTDQAYRAQQNYLRDLREAQRLHREGALVGKDYERTISGIKNEFARVWTQEVQGGRNRELGKSPMSRLSLHQSRNLGFQVNDVLTGIMSGQSLPMIAAQQGGQIWQILSDGPGGAGGSIKRLGGYLSGLMTPLRVAAGGFVALGVAAGAALNGAINRSIAATQAVNGIGRASGVSADQLMSIARQAAGAGNISNIAGMQYASAFAGAGINGGLAGRLTGTVRRFSQAFGGGEDDNAAMLARAFADPAAGAQELNKRLGFLSAEMDLTIKRQQALGNLEGARETLFKAYNESLRNATIETNGLQQAFHAVKVAASNLWEAFGRALTPDSLQERLDKAAKVRSTPNPFTGTASGYDGESFSDLFRQAIGEAGKRLAEERKIEENRLSFLRLQQTRLMEDGSLAVASILARTSAEKAAVESQKAYIQTLRETNSAVLAGIAAENARNSAIAEATRALRDHARMVFDEGFMGGARNEREQFIRQMQLQNRNLYEQTNILGRPADDQWRSQIKYSERAGNLWTGGDGTGSRGLNFGQFPTGLSPNFGNSLSALFSQFPMLANGGSNGSSNAPAGPRQLTVTRNGFGAPNNTPGGIDQDRLSMWENNRFGQMMHDATVAIQANQRALDAQRMSFGMSSEEVARYTERTRLENEVVRTGIPLTEERRQKIDEVAKAYAATAAQQERFRETLQTLNDIRGGVADFGNSVVGAFIRGERGAKLLQTGLNSLLNTVSRMSMNFLMKGLFGDQNFSGGLFSSVLGSLFGLGGGGTATVAPSALGNVFSGGNIVPFARGGIVNRPTLFPMAKGAGLMGEAGPEAILPLRRGSDGRLGVASQRGGGEGVQVNVHNYSRSEVKTEERQGPDGRKIIEMLVEEKVGSMLGSGGADGAMRARYGVSARKVLRG